MRFVRVGTLDRPHEFAPDVHIYTASKAPWVEIPKDASADERFYDVGIMWAKETDERRWAVMEKIRALATAQEPKP